MPKRVLIIGLLFMLFGALAIWTVIEAALRNRIYLNFGVFLFPVGIGLLRGKISSRWWARMWIILGYLGIGLMIVLALASPQSLSASWFDAEVRGRRAVPYVIAAAAVLAAGLIVCHRLLYSPKANGYFFRR
jgi:hypothetical protein